MVTKCDKMWQDVTSLIWWKLHAAKEGELPVVRRLRVAYASHSEASEKAKLQVAIGGVWPANHGCVQVVEKGVIDGAPLAVLEDLYPSSSDISHHFSVTPKISESTVAVREMMRVLCCSPSEISDTRTSFCCRAGPSTKTSTRPQTCRVQFR